MGLQEEEIYIFFTTEPEAGRAHGKNSFRGWKIALYFFSKSFISCATLKEQMEKVFFFGGGILFAFPFFDVVVIVIDD